MKKDAFDVPPSNYEINEINEIHHKPNAVYWIFTMFGTAVGAGILYLPVQAGLCGIWPLLIISIFMFPVVYFSHKAIVDLLMSNRLLRDYSGSINKHFGVVFGFFINIIFFMTWFFCLTAYSIGLNENTGIYLKELGITANNPAKTIYLSLIILIILFGMIRFCKAILLKIMSVLSVLLIILLFGISVYLIPQWNLNLFLIIPKPSEIIIQILLIIPLLIMSFVFFPAMSAMVIAYRRSYDADKTSSRRLNRIVLHSTWILLVFVLFFVFSCVLSLPKEAFQTALKQNINCLTLISMRMKGSGPLAGLGTIIGLAALTTSFIGVFFAVRESAHHIIITICRSWFKKEVTKNKIDSFVLIFLLLFLWGLTITNLSVVAMFSALVAPLVAIFLYILPIVIFYIKPKLKGHRKLINIIVFCIGILLLFSYNLGNFLEKLFTN
jgi:serine transporter